MANFAKKGSPGGRPTRGALVRLPYALRMDTSIPVGAGGEIPALRLACVSPDAGERGVKGFEVLLVPN